MTPMTRDRWRKLSIDRRNLKLARLMGYTLSNWRSGNSIGVHRLEDRDGDKIDVHGLLDDYCNNLNHVHIAENELLRDDIILNIHYLNKLVEIVGVYDLEAPICRATAAQRAEALVLAVEEYNAINNEASRRTGDNIRSLSKAGSAEKQA